MIECSLKIDTELVRQRQNRPKAGGEFMLYSTIQVWAGIPEVFVLHDEPRKSSNVIGEPEHCLGSAPWTACFSDLQGHVVLLDSTRDRAQFV